MVSIHGHKSIIILSFLCASFLTTACMNSINGERVAAQYPQSLAPMIYDPPPAYEFFALPVEYLTTAANETHVALPEPALTNALLARAVRKENVALIKSVGKTRATANAFAGLGCIFFANLCKDCMLLPLLNTSDNFKAGVVLFDAAVVATFLVTGAICEKSHKTQRTKLIKLLHRLDGLEESQLENCTSHPAYTKPGNIMTTATEHDPLIQAEQILSPIHKKYARHIARITNIGQTSAQTTGLLTLGAALLFNGIKDVGVYSSEMFTPTLTAAATLGANLLCGTAAIIYGCHKESKLKEKKAAHKRIMANIDELIIAEEQLTH